MQNSFNILPRETLDGLDQTVPFFLVGEEIFKKVARKKWLMRPLAGKQLTAGMRKVFDYRLSRARRVRENTFWN